MSFDERLFIDRPHSPYSLGSFEENDRIFLVIFNFYTNDLFITERQSIQSCLEANYFAKDVFVLFETLSDYCRIFKIIYFGSMGKVFRNLFCFSSLIGTAHNYDIM
jgi:hypothetical protein